MHTCRLNRLEHMNALEQLQVLFSIILNFSLRIEILGITISLIYHFLEEQQTGSSFEAADRTFRPVVFYSISGTLISIFEGFFIVLLLEFVFT